MSPSYLWKNQIKRNDSVNLRWKKNPIGSQNAYLNLCDKGIRKKKYIGIKILKNDSQGKEQKLKAEAIKTKYHNAIIKQNIELINFDRFISLWTEHYSKMDDIQKNMLPLHAVYFSGSND